MILWNFVIQEFVPPEVYEELGERSILVVDYRILKTAEQVREFFAAPVRVNTWHNGGQLRYRGYRPASYKCAKWSQHRYGRAIDFDVDGYTPDQVRETILVNRSKFAYITAMETGVPWVHVDCRSSLTDEILMFAK